MPQWCQVVDTNLVGSFLCAHHAVQTKKVQDPRGGRIIANGSVSVHSPRPRRVGYTATKHAITGPAGIALVSRSETGQLFWPTPIRSTDGPFQAEPERAATPLWSRWRTSTRITTTPGSMAHGL